MLKSEVPRYLRSSGLFRNMDDGDQDEYDTDGDSEKNQELLIVPTEKTKLSTDVTSVNELDQLLNTLDYWMSDELPEDLVLFCLKNPCNEHVLGKLEQFHNKLPQLRFVMFAASQPLVRTKVKMAVKENDMQLLRAIHKVEAQKGRNVPSHFFDMDFAEVFNIAARNGNLECMKYLKLMGCLTGAHWSIVEACKGGNIDCLMYADELGCKIESDSTACTEAARYGHIDCLKYLHARDAGWNSRTCVCAAKGGHIECLQYLHTSGCDWDIRTCNTAAEAGSLQCLQYAYEHGCPVNDSTMLAAARGGHLACVQYLYNNNCPWHADVISAAVSKRERSHDCVRYMHENGAPWDATKTLKLAARNGDFASMVYAYSNGGVIDTRHLAYDAAMGGSIECLQFAFDHSCRCSAAIFELAARYGYLNCLKLARETTLKRCPWTSRTLENAVKFNNQACLQYAVEHKCPGWELYTSACVNDGSPETLQSS